jgi:hypothetical protein
VPRALPKRRHNYINKGITMQLSLGMQRWLPAAVLVAGCIAPMARADVTVQQETTFDVTMIKAHSTATEYTTADKQRRDSDTHCDGLMSIMCRNMANEHIVRLDRDVEWSLEPSKKEYVEHALPTAAEREAAAARARAELEKLKSCPAVQQNSSAPDTSKCDMSPPKLDEKQTDQHQTIGGHDSRLTRVTLTQSCRNRETNDTCDFVFAMDSWLTQDTVPGAADRKAFATAYMKKLGLDQMSAQTAQGLQQFLAPYQDSLKQLSAKADDFKGYPMRTAFAISFGGAQCAAAKNASAQNANASVPNPLTDASGAAADAATGSAAGAAGSAAGQAAANAAGNSVAGGVLGSAASAFGSKLTSGLFHKKSDSGSAATAPAAAAGPPADPNMVRVAAITVETTSITTDPIPADKFEIPAGWKQVTVRANRPEKEFSCPSSGH